MATNLGAANDYMAAYVGSSVSLKQDVYKNLYEEIRNCNIILGEFEDGRDTREGQDIVGTAYALRGVCYYQLLRMFCEPPLADATKPGVPIVTEFDMEAKPIRSTMQETIDQAERDLKTALACDIQEKMYRFNNDVLHGYLARLYHWCGRWQEARDEARLVLEKHPLLSGDDYVKMYGTFISHNSYKSSPATNSFKWDRKIAVKVALFLVLYLKLSEIHTDCFFV